MNCEEVKANLSPYVAGDIERHGAREMIETHLRACESCRASAEEWEASHRLLQLHEPPEFDAAFFDSVRRNVMREINEPKPSLLARIFGRPFGQRTLTYAAVFSMLVCAAVLSAHFLRGKQTPPAEVAKEKKVGTENVEKNAVQFTSERAQGGGTANANQVNAVAPSPRPGPSPQRRIRRESAPERKSVNPSPKPEEVQTANVREVQRVVSPTFEPRTTVPPNRVETASADREMLRIELQTADPNIRIIWLSPRTTGSASANKTDR